MLDIEHLNKVASSFYFSYSKVTIEGALSLIGGTMGLLTGFSILSGVEIVYFMIKLLLSLRKRVYDLRQD